ncbi:hypothetical protein FKP32DRAFT_818562 [Trametes sanguinea]|nr:hypothetical protein FKP32DRAFT_818562 [Trametes sanguinea]
MSEVLHRSRARLTSTPILTSTLADICCVSDALGIGASNAPTTTQLPTHGHPDAAGPPDHGRVRARLRVGGDVAWNKPSETVVNGLPMRDKRLQQVAHASRCHRIVTVISFKPTGHEALCAHAPENQNALATLKGSKLQLPDACADAFPCFPSPVIPTRTQAAVMHDGPDPRSTRIVSATAVTSSNFNSWTFGGFET